MSGANYLAGDLDSLSVHKLPLGTLFRNASGQGRLFGSVWRNPDREDQLNQLWLANPQGTTGGHWRAGGFYEFDWPPTGPSSIICQ